MLAYLIYPGYRHTSLGIDVTLKLYTSSSYLQDILPSTSVDELIEIKLTSLVRDLIELNKATFRYDTIA